MSLCIICEAGVDSSGSHVGYAMADSRLTVTGPRDGTGPQSRRESGAVHTLLPSDQEVRHRTDLAVKLHIVNVRALFAERPWLPVVFCVAGAASLGLHSLLHLAARVDGMMLPRDYDKVTDFVCEALAQFWRDAHDKDIEYLFAYLRDGTLRIERLWGNARAPELRREEVRAEHGLTFAVIGDDAEGVHGEILGETCALSAAGCDPERVVWLACVRALRRRIEAPSVWTVGGGIQMAHVATKSAGHMAVLMGRNECYFRGAPVPVLDGLGEQGGGRRCIDLCEPKYNPNLSISDIVCLG